MGIFNNFKLRIANFLLKRKLKNHSRYREVKNLHQCNSILILSFLPEDENGIKTMALTEELKQMKKQVSTLIYTDKIKGTRPSQLADIDLITIDKLNKIYTPKDSYILELINREFDLLIDLSLSDQFPLKYIYALSKAQLKSGAGVNYKSQYGDVLIDLGEEESVSYLIAQVKHYLSNINIQKKYVT